MFLLQLLRRVACLWAVVGVILLPCGVSVACAQQALPIDRTIKGARILEAFEPVVRASRESVVRVFVKDQPVSLGLIVTADGLVVSKASEIDPIQPIAIQRGAEKWAAVPVGWSEPHDLMVLKAEQTGGPLPVWSKGADPAIGQFLITPGTEKLPLSVGVVSVARRPIPKDQIHGILGVQLEAEREEAIIENLFDGSAAKAAGLEVGDMIVKVGEVAIPTRRALIEEIFKHAPGETVLIEIRRKDKTLVIPATLTHPFGDFLSRIAQQNRLGGEVSRRASGFPAAIQHDSVLKPADCGGPVVNIDGQIVGVNIARSGRTESLLIPAEVVQEVLLSYQAGQLPRPQTHSPGPPPSPPSATEIKSPQP